MKKILYATAAFFILSTSSYASSYPTNIEGTYDCDCIEVGTKENYKGVVTVKKTGDTYSVGSTFNDGSSYFGTGIYDLKTHQFSLAFYNPKKADESGIAVADVKENYAMNSTWTYMNKTIVSTSTCTKRQA